MLSTAINPQQKLTDNHLINYIDQVFIIAYKESTEKLEEVLKQEGFQCEVIRQEFQPEFQG